VHSGARLICLSSGSAMQVRNSSGLLGFKPGVDAGDGRSRKPLPVALGIPGTHGIVLSSVAMTLFMLAGRQALDGTLTVMPNLNVAKELPEPHP
jgi:hypothetical protein